MSSLAGLSITADTIVQVALYHIGTVVISAVLHLGAFELFTSDEITCAGCLYRLVVRWLKASTFSNRLLLGRQERDIPGKRQEELSTVTNCPLRCGTPPRLGA